MACVTAAACLQTQRQAVDSSAGERGACGKGFPGALIQSQAQRSARNHSELATESMQAAWGSSCFVGLELLFYFLAGRGGARRAWHLTCRGLHFLLSTVDMTPRPPKLRAKASGVREEMTQPTRLTGLRERCLRSPAKCFQSLPRVSQQLTVSLKEP